MKTVLTFLLAILLLTTLVGCNGDMDNFAPASQASSVPESGAVADPKGNETTSTTALTTTTSEQTKETTTTTAKTTAAVPHVCAFAKRRTVAATCSSQGYTEYACSCGKTEKRNVTATNEQHNFQGVTPVSWKDATGQMYNTYATVCKNCGLQALRHGQENDESQTYYYLAVVPNSQPLSLKLYIYGSGPMSDYGVESGHCPGWSVYQHRISSVTIAEGVTSVGDYAFYEEMQAIHEFHISSTVKRIGEGGMYGVQLAEIRLGENVEEVGARAIDEVSLGRFYVPATMKKMEVYPDRAIVYYQGTEEMYRRIMMRRKNDVVYLRTMEEFFEDCKQSTSYYHYDDRGISDRVKYNAW